MRRIAMAVLTAGVTMLTPVAAPASADVGFWRSAGLPGVDAFGVYRTRAARVRVSFLLRDPKKDRYGAAVRFTFTEPHHRNAVRVAALRPGVRRRWRTVGSANDGHLYVQECVGRWHGKTFRTTRCAGWRRRY
jgi:hypothetical protein